MDFASLLFYTMLCVGLSNRKRTFHIEYIVSYKDPSVDIYDGLKAKFIAWTTVKSLEKTD
ncbi:MAG: hypothetical protein ACMUEM_07405 [Flavobacteriales bacterium AspAUS03]